MILHEKQFFPIFLCANICLPTEAVTSPQLFKLTLGQFQLRSKSRCYFQGMDARNARISTFFRCRWTSLASRQILEIKAPRVVMTSKHLQRRSRANHSSVSGDQVVSSDDAQHKYRHEQIFPTNLGTFVVNFIPISIQIRREHRKHMKIPGLPIVTQLWVVEVLCRQIR